MSRSKCSRELYCSFLEITSERYSALSLSDVAPYQLSHDSISRWLADERIQPKDIWAIAQKEITKLEDFQKKIISELGQPKRVVEKTPILEKSIELFKQTLDYRIWNPPDDGKTKNNHFKEMLAVAKQRDLSPEMVVADSWYSSLDNLKTVRLRLGLGDGTTQ